MILAVRSKRASRTCSLNREKGLIIFAISVSALGLFAGCGSEGSRMHDAANAELHSSSDLAHDTQNLAGNRESLRLLMEHDFGLMKPLQTATHGFVVTNPSQSPWHLSRIRSSCGCTVISHSSNVIRPQWSERFEVRFTAGADRRGSKKSAITLDFDGAPGAEVRLQVSAEIRNSIEISPSLVRFTVTDGMEPASQLLIVENYSEERWSSIDVKSSVDWLKPQVPESTQIKDGGRAIQRWVVPLGVTRDVLHADDQVSGMGTTLMVDVDGGKQRETVHVSVVKIRPIVVFPSSITLGQLAAGGTIDKKVIVKFNVQDLDVTGEDISLSLKSGRELQLEHHMWEMLAPTTWELCLRFRAGQVESHQTDIVRDEVVITFPNSSKLPHVSVGVTSRISSGKSG